MKKIRIAATTLLLLATVSTAAMAFPSETRQNVTLRTGPGTNYGILGYMGRNNPVSITGCTTDWEWCKVSGAGMNGWVSASGLDVDYRGRSTPISGPVGEHVSVPVFDQSSVTPGERTYTHWYDRFRN